MEKLYVFVAIINWLIVEKWLNITAKISEYWIRVKQTND